MQGERDYLRPRAAGRDVLAVSESKVSQSRQGSCVDRMPVEGGGQRSTDCKFQP